MKMIISEYWEHVDHEHKDHRGWGTVIKGEYDLKGTTIFNDSWSSPDEFYRERAKGRKSYRGRAGGCFFFDLGTIYGIHSYQTVEVI